MNKILFLSFLLLIQLSQCDLGITYGYSGVNPTSFYECVASQGYKQISLSSDFRLSTTTYLLAQWEKMRNTGLILDIFLILCRSTNPLDYVTQLLTYTPKGFDGTFYILPAPFSEPNRPECSWDVNLYSSESNCQQLKLYVKIMKERGLKVGIYAQPLIWFKVFNRGGCPDFGSEKLFWNVEKPGQNFDDFIPFGGWTKPTIKLLSPTVTICGKTVARTYFEK